MRQFLVTFKQCDFGCAISSLTDYETFFRDQSIDIYFPKVFFLLKAPSIRLLLMSFRTIALQKIELVLISSKTRIFQFQFWTPNFVPFLLTTNITEETKCPENSTHLKRRIKKMNVIIKSWMKFGLHGKYSGLEPLMQVPKVVLEYEGSWDERSPGKKIVFFQALLKHYNGCW